MSTISPTAEFSPADVSDAGLAELRTTALSAMNAAPKFSQWLHAWCDTEQARRARGETTATRRHCLCLPVLTPWTAAEVGEALEACGIMVHAVQDFTASQFAERLQLAIVMEGALRLRTTGEIKNEN